MLVKKFSELDEKQLDTIIDMHFCYWIKYNPKMEKEKTIYKFRQLYTKDTLPFGIALFDENENIIGFCVFKIENLKKYPEIYPWISDLMIVEKYRGKGYGKILIEKGKDILKKIGYDRVYVWTDQVPDFYKKLGFTYLHKVQKNEGGYGELFCLELKKENISYSFRTCTLDDFDFLFELKKQNFKWYVDKIWGWKDEDQKQRLKKDLEEHLAHKSIIMLDNKEIGVYAVHSTETGDFFINEISLLKEYQGLGIGTAILNKQLKENSAKGIRTILQVFKDNPAKNLYKRLGFKIYNETETHYQMEKL